MRKFRDWLRNSNPAFFWPILALISIVVLWTLVNARLSSEKNEVRINAFGRAISIAQAYSEQLSHSVALYDQITQTTKFNWEKASGNLQLEEYVQAGIYPASKSIYVSIVDKNGILVSSTLTISEPVDYSKTEWFKWHKTAAPQGLNISGPHVGLVTGREVIRFSRRLQAANGSFAGIVWVSVEPDNLGSFYGERNLHDEDFISVRLNNGPLLATKMSRPVRMLYREDPVYDEWSSVREEPADRFVDSTPRIVAWSKLEDYPLMALAAISESNAYEAFETEKKDLLEIVSAATLFIVLLTIAAMYLTTHLYYKRRRDQEVKSIFRLAVDGGRDGFYMISPVFDQELQPLDFRIEDCNQQGAMLAGYEKQDLIGKSFSEIYSGHYLEQMIGFFRTALEKGFYEDEMAVSPQGRIKAKWLQRRAVRSGLGLAMTVRDISEGKAHEQAMLEMANADALTSLPNRHWLNWFLPGALQQEKARGGLLAILFIDLDNFKNINDTLGHQAGDELLKAAAMRLKSLVRGSDHVVRLGGDEFTIVLEQVERIDEVHRVAGKIIQSLGEPFKLGNSSGNHVKASVGISLFPQDGEDGETLLKNADIAMYAAKAAGKGRYHFYQAHLSDRLLLKINREQALRHAIERDQFVLHYQPRVDTYTGQLRSMEALVRWNDPERGLIAPAEFIHVAEETGLILKLGEMIIEKACRQMAEWKTDGLQVVPVSINVSALQFNEGNVKSILAACMERYAIEPSLIGVELTESCMIEDDVKVPHELEALRSLGVKLLIDDFGTGYSSLAQLQELDVDILKIDQAFTRRICMGEEGKALFKAIVSMADALDICIVAEGVETVEQLHLLQVLSCEEVQGHLISRPVPAGEMAGIMSRGYLMPQYA